MLTKQANRGPAPAQTEELAPAVAAAALQPGNRELHDQLLGPLPADREEDEERPWLDAPEYGVASMLVGLRAPPPTLFDR